MRAASLHAHLPRDLSTVDEKTAEIFAHFQQVRGNVPKIVRTVAPRPEITRTLLVHLAR